MMIKLECRLTNLHVAEVRTLRALVAEFDYLTAQSKVGQLGPEGIVKLNDVIVAIAGFIAEWCSGTACFDGKSFALGPESHRQLLDLQDVTIAEIGRRMVGLTEDEAKKSGAASLPPFEVRPAQ